MSVILKNNASFSSGKAPNRNFCVENTKVFLKPNSSKRSCLFIFFNPFNFYFLFNHFKFLFFFIQSFLNFYFNEKSFF